MISFICLCLYYGFARFLPTSSTRIVGKPSKWLRGMLCRHIFKKCGKNVNIERLAHFESGREIEIGDNSGLGINCRIPKNTVIGENVMMGPDCTILPYNHSFERTDIPMIQQGFHAKGSVRTVIGNDVWIGMKVTMTPGRKISNGTVIGACCLLCKDFPAYSVVGGNPSVLIKSRNCR